MMEGTYAYSPFYPLSGTGGQATPPSTFKIGSFVNDMLYNEIGSTVTSVTFDWIILNGAPTMQSIMPTVGDLAAGLRTYTLSGQSITSNTNFTLEASDGNVRRTKTSSVSFVRPIFFGTVSDAVPTETEILGTTKRISSYTPFMASLNISNVRSCFAAPMANPIVDIKERVLGLSILNTYDVLNNYYLTMLDGITIPYKVYVKQVPEDTMGIDMDFDIFF